MLMRGKVTKKRAHSKRKMYLFFVCLQYMRRKSYALSLLPGSNTAQCFVCSLMTAKSSKAYIAFTRWAKADSWRTYHVSTIEQFLEELPRG